MIGELTFSGEDLLYAGYYYVNGDKNIAMQYLMTATAHITIAAGMWNLNFNAGLFKVGNLSEKANVDVKSAGQTSYGKSSENVGKTSYGNHI